MKIIKFGNNKNLIHRKMRERRIALGISQSDMAAYLQLMGIGIDQQGISKIERDARIVTDYEALHISRVLTIELEQLFDESE